MTIKVDSQALGITTKALGLTGRGSSETELVDGTVDQVLDVGPIVRRSRTFAQSQGLFYGLLRNIHSAANNVSTTILPYNIQEAGAANPPFPAPVPDTFDLWLIEASVTRLSGAGALTNGFLALRWPAENQGFGLISNLNPIISVKEGVVAHWDALVTVAATTFAVLAGAGEDVVAKLNIRLPYNPSTAGPTIRFQSVSSAAATFDMLLYFGLFPVGLGQDAAF